MEDNISNILINLLKEVRHIEKKIRNLLKQKPYIVNQRLQSENENLKSQKEPNYPTTRRKEQKEKIRGNKEGNNLIWKKKEEFIKNPIKENVTPRPKDQQLIQEDNAHTMEKHTTIQQQSQKTIKTQVEPKEITFKKEKETKFNQKVADDYKEEGNTYYNDGKIEQAHRSYQKALEYAPLDARIHANIANCWNKQHDYKKCFCVATEILDDPKLENKNDAVIKGMIKLSIKCSIQLKHREVAIAYVEFGTKIFSTNEFEKLFQVEEEQKKMKKKKKKQKPPS